MLRLLLVVGLLATIEGGFGKKKEKDGAARMQEDLDAEMDGGANAAAAAAAGMGAREWELENVRRSQLLTPSHLRSLMALRLAQAMRHKTGELNTAELGFENMKAAMQDPSVMAETMKLMQDPEAQRKVKEMMADPAFQAQAQQAMQAMQKAGGGAPAG